MTKRIAVVTTEYTPKSHADVIVSRWLEPRPTDPLYGWSNPSTRIASLFVAQKPRDRDLPREKSGKYGTSPGARRLAFLRGSHQSSLDASVFANGCQSHPVAGLLK